MNNCSQLLTKNSKLEHYQYISVEIIIITDKNQLKEFFNPTCFFESLSNKTIEYPLILAGNGSKTTHSLKLIKET